MIIRILRSGSCFDEDVGKVHARVGLSILYGPLERGIHTDRVLDGCVYVDFG